MFAKDALSEVIENFFNSSLERLFNLSMLSRMRKNVVDANRGVVDRARRDWGLGLRWS